MVQLIACFSIGSVEKYGSSPESESVDDSQMRRLLNIDFDSLVKYGVMWRHGIAENQMGGEVLEGRGLDGGESEENTPWMGLRHMRGHVLVLLLFHIFKKYGASLGKGAWIAVTKVLLWARHRRVLPDELIELDDFSNARGGALPLSVYAGQCEQRLLGEEARRRAAQELLASNREQSIWESVASLGGLLWAPGGVTPPSSASSKYPASSLQRSASMGVSVMTKRSLHVLEQCMLKSGIENLLFAWTKDISNDGLADVIWCLFAEVVGSTPAVFNYVRATEERYSGRHQGRLASFLGADGGGLEVSTGDGNGHSHGLEQGYPQEKRRAADIVEIDAVTVLEWVSRIVFVNRHRSASVWPIVHGECCLSMCVCVCCIAIYSLSLTYVYMHPYVCVFAEFLQHVLEKDVDDMCAACPFLVERAVVAVVSAAIHLMREPVGDSSVSVVAPTPVGALASAGPVRAMVTGATATVTADDSTGVTMSPCSPPPGPPSGRGNIASAAALWASLRLLREVPHDVMANVSDRLGAGLVTFIRYVLRASHDTVLISSPHAQRIPRHGCRCEAGTLVPAVQFAHDSRLESSRHALCVGNYLPPHR